MSETSIEWTDVTWNPVRGCSRVSAGCRNCYAEKIASRFSRLGMAFDGFAYDNFAGNNGRRKGWTGKVALVPEKLDEPLRWRKPRRVFVNSMSDLFHEALPEAAIQNVFSVMEGAQRHTFQILTKRPARMLAWVKAFDEWLRYAGSVPFSEKLPNVWLGVSVEDQATADERIPLLLQTPAAKRFVSYEPALGPVDFSQYLPDEQIGGVRLETWPDWIIVGGESGPGARPFDVAWARFTVQQCKAAGVAVFVKQLGARPFDSAGDRGLRPRMERAAIPYIRDPKGGDPSEWPEDLRVREFPA